MNEENIMSSKYRDVSEVPTSVLIARLEQLSDAVANNNMNEFVMRIPAEVDHDADIVLAEAAKRLEFYRRNFDLNSAA